MGSIHEWRDVRVRLSRAEYEDLATAARQLDVSISDIIRQAAGYRPITEARQVRMATHSRLYLASTQRWSSRR